MLIDEHTWLFPFNCFSTLNLIHKSPSTESCLSHIPFFSVAGQWCIAERGFSSNNKMDSKKDYSAVSNINLKEQLSLFLNWKQQVDKLV